MTDREKLIGLTSSYFSGYRVIDMVNYLISNGVTIQKHGRWVVDGVYVVCSVCNRLTLSPIIKQLPTFRYCPNCGAKMDLEE